MSNKNILDDDDEPMEQRIILPKHKSRWGWIVLLLILVVAAGGWYCWNNLNHKPDVVDFASCTQASGVMLETYPEQCVANGKSYTNPNQQAPEPPVAETPQAEPEEPKLASYTDTANAFTVQYPADFVQSTIEVPPPYTNSSITITSQSFSHTAAVQHCNMKGDCTPTTMDISMSFSVVNSSVNTISKSPKVGTLTDVTFGTNAFKTFNQGIEGEGIYYYFISLPNKKTLMVSRTYVSEAIIPNYQTAKDFIKTADQDKLAEQILTSLTFNQ